MKTTFDDAHLNNRISSRQPTHENMGILARQRRDDFNNKSKIGCRPSAVSE